jgi:hypothetical protein
MIDKIKIALILLALCLYGKFIIYDGNKYIDNRSQNAIIK